MLVTNNLIERAGNVAVILNNVRGATVTNNTTVDAGNLNTFTTDRGLRIRAKNGILGLVTAGFEEIYSAGFRNAAYGNYRNDPSSDGVDAGTDASAAAYYLDSDIWIGTVDVGAFESEVLVEGYVRGDRPL